MRLNRDDYAKMPREEVERRLRSVLDRMVRAQTSESYLADAYDEQELSAALEPADVAR